jgi:hypothetical protein
VFRGQVPDLIQDSAINQFGAVAAATFVQG